MSRRTGTADLPLHGGRAPRWLFERMARLAPAIVEAMVLDRGPEVVLQRLSDPFWFQAFGCVLGFDWHSSGVTTTVCGALKTGLADRGGDVGIWVAGGKGRASRRTPEELGELAGRLALDGEALVRASRTSARVDSAAVQDGFQIYHHSFFLTSAGRWAVVQQGMRDVDGGARRYHWLGERVTDFVCEPHAAVASDAGTQTVLNLVARESGAARTTTAELARESPDRVIREVERIRAGGGTAGSGGSVAGESMAGGAGAKRTVSRDGGEIATGGEPASGRESMAGWDGEQGRLELVLPRRHAVDPRADIDPRYLRKALLATYEAQPADFEGLLGVAGVGAKTVRALALVAELTYGTPASVRDVARFSFAHGGKDGHPFPVDRDTYDRSIHYLREAVDRAKVGHTDRVAALKRLARWEGRDRSTDR